MVKHKHHIIPRHAGGTDEPSNLVELTIAEHAEAHKKLYETYGRKEDYWAWMGLTGQIGKDEILKQIAMAQKGIKKPDGFGEKISSFRKTFRYSEESKKKMSDAKKGKVVTQEHRKKISESLMGRKQSDQQKRKVREALQCEWIVTSPQGEMQTIVNLRQFCLENGLDQGNMSRGKHKGWLCRKVL